MGDYEIVIHRRGSLEPIRIPLPDTADDVAEADRETLMFEIEQGRHAEAPSIPVRTASGHPSHALTVDPHDVTEVDLILLPYEDDVDDEDETVQA